MRPQPVTPTKEFVRAWHAWRHSHVPTDNFRLGRLAADSYGIELDLDHLHSRLYSLGSAVLDGKMWEYERFAAEELADLDKVGTKIEGTGMAESAKEKFREYSAVARRLLEAMKNQRPDDGAV